MKKIIGCVFVAVLALACTKDEKAQRHFTSDLAVQVPSAQVLDVPVVQAPKPVPAETEVTAVITLSKPDTVIKTVALDEIVCEVDAKAIHSWADYSEAKMGMWTRYSERKSAAWVNFTQDKGQAWSWYISEERKNRNIFRGVDHKNYIEWLDARDQNDFDLQQRIEGVVPAAKTYAQATAAAHQEVVEGDLKEAEARRDAVLEKIEEVLKQEKAALEEAAKNLK